MTVVVAPGDLPPSGGGSYGLAPPACICSRGGSPGQTASVCPAFQLEGAGRPCRQRFLSYPGTFRQAGGARTASPPRLHMLAGGAARVRRKCLSRVSAGSREHSPRQVAAAGKREGRASDGFCRTQGHFGPLLLAKQKKQDSADTKVMLTHGHLISLESNMRTFTNQRSQQGSNLRP